MAVLQKGGKEGYLARSCGEAMKGRPQRSRKNFGRKDEGGDVRSKIGKEESGAVEEQE